MESSSSDRLNEIKNERPYTPVILYWEKSVNGRKEVNGVWYIHEATLKHVRAGMTPFDTANLGLPQYTFDLRALEDRFVEVTPDHLITTILKEELKIFTRRSELLAVLPKFKTALTEILFMMHLLP